MNFKKFFLSEPVKKGLGIASAVAQFLPSREDSAFTTTVKALGAIGKARDVFVENLGEETTLRISHGLTVRHTSLSFVNLFLTSPPSSFNIRDITCTNGRFILADNGLGSVLLFTVYCYDSGDYIRALFWCSEGVEIEELVSSSWSSFGGGMYITKAFGARDEWVFSKVVSPKNPLFGADQEVFDKLLARHRRYSVDTVGRTYMFYGLPGTGKTSFAAEMADRLGARLLKFDTSKLKSTEMLDILQLVEYLSPDVVLLDDIDKAHTNEFAPLLLDFVSEVKAQLPQTVVIMTANTIDKLDRGLFRPNRIDTWVEFKLPDENLRREILRGYLIKSEIPIDDSVVDVLVRETNGLSHDYVREAACALKYEHLEDIVANVRLQVKRLTPLTGTKTVAE